jgi:hypothetical protein
MNMVSGFIREHCTVRVTRTVRQSRFPEEKRESNSRCCVLTEQGGMRPANCITRRGDRERGEIKGDRQALVGLPLLKERDVSRFSSRGSIAG